MKILIILCLIFFITFINCSANNQIKNKHKRQAYVLSSGWNELIKSVNPIFKCERNGYFADIANGCQLYHVCESAFNQKGKSGKRKSAKGKKTKTESEEEEEDSNSESSDEGQSLSESSESEDSDSDTESKQANFRHYSFVCGEGTVFNQLTFTCTRVEESIPCESSANFYYLNERIGDPNAYFLTEGDIALAKRLPMHPRPSPTQPPSRPRPRPPLPRPIVIVSQPQPQPRPPLLTDDDELIILDN